MFNPETPPELAVSRWFNAREPLSLARLRGRVVIVVAFQMLCPGCVEHALPQAKRLAARFRPEEVTVLGLHSVFEHHHAMPPEALEVFVSEFRLPFPVAVDAPQGDGPPSTMTAYQMQGTPTLLVFDRAGRLRRHYFGQPDDILLAAEIMALAIEDPGSPREQAAVIERKVAAALAGDAHDHGSHDHHHHHDHDEDCGCEHGHGHAQHGDSDRRPDRAAAETPAAGHAAHRLREAERMTEPPRELNPKG